MKGVRTDWWNPGRHVGKKGAMILVHPLWGDNRAKTSLPSHGLNILKTWRNCFKPREHLEWLGSSKWFLRLSSLMSQLGLGLLVVTLFQCKLELETIALRPKTYVFRKNKLVMSLKIFIFTLKTLIFVPKPIMWVFFSCPCLIQQRYSRHLLLCTKDVVDIVGRLMRENLGRQHRGDCVEGRWN